MNMLRIGLHAVIVSAVGMSFAGCGGLQSPLGAAGATSHFSSAMARSNLSGSWMLPEAKNDDLIYAYNTDAGNLYVLSYPAGKLVGAITGLDTPQGACVDNSGNVWIANYSINALIEYAHGGTEPIATLQEGGNAEPQACSVDPSSGDMAVTNRYPTAIAVFKNATGSPTMYKLDGFSYWGTCAYDGAGDLFANDWADSKAIAELPRGARALQAIPLKKPFLSYGMQWDGEYLAMRRLPRGPLVGPTVIERVQVSNSIGSIVAETSLDNRDNRQPDFVAQLFIDGSTIIGPQRFRGTGSDPRGTSLDIWSYPAGGKRLKAIVRNASIDGVVISRAKSNLPHATRPG
jgi:hypothetical protein